MPSYRFLRLKACLLDEDFVPLNIKLSKSRTRILSKMPFYHFLRLKACLLDEGRVPLTIKLSKSRTRILSKMLPIAS